MRKFMIVVDETPECRNAMHFAARRAKNTGGGVLMLYVIAPDDFQHWVGVAELMRQEARDAAEARLNDLAEELQSRFGVIPEFVIREGNRTDEVLGLIENDREIGVLCLGAGEGDNPGPLVSQLVSKMGGRMPIPVTVVPGAMTEERLDAVC